MIDPADRVDTMVAGEARLYRPPLAPRAHTVNQLALDLATPPEPTLENFVCGANAETLAILQDLAHGAARAAWASQTELRAIYLWGPPGSGRSHLLQALARVLPAKVVRLLDADAPPEAFVHDPMISHWLIDDCDQLDAVRQEAAFHLFTALQTQRTAVWMATGEAPPAALPVMPELATRLGWGLVLQLHRLSDADTALALQRTLSERGVAASADLVPWLMTHAPRNLGQLRALIDALDAYALSRKRAITLPLLREFARTDPPGTRAMPEPGDSPVGDLP